MHQDFHGTRKKLQDFFKPRLNFLQLAYTIVYQTKQVKDMPQ